jgi:hypothetical protein
MKNKSKTIIIEHKLNSGALNKDAFYQLIALTSICSKKNIAALEDYYVNGLSKSDSYKKNGVDKTIFSRKLSAMNDVFLRVMLFLQCY